MKIGDNIKKIRKEKGLTQKELAAKCKLAEITIRQYENNKRTPSTAALQNIANKLGVNIFKLINIDDYFENKRLEKEDVLSEYLEYLGFEIQMGTKIVTSSSTYDTYVIEHKDKQYFMSIDEYDKIVSNIDMFSKFVLTEFLRYAEPFTPEDKNEDN